MMKNTTLVGNIGEQLAADYLKAAGYKILDRNLKICSCEVDIIAEAYIDKNGAPIVAKAPFKRLLSNINPTFVSKGRGERTVIFCEVKTRLTAEFGSGAEAVTPYKAARYVTAAKAYMAGRFDANTAVRFDIIEVGDGEVGHIVNAFDENYAKFCKK